MSCNDLWQSSLVPISKQLIQWLSFQLHTNWSSFKLQVVFIQNNNDH